MIPGQTLLSTKPEWWPEDITHIVWLLRVILLHLSNSFCTTVVKLLLLRREALLQNEEKIYCSSLSIGCLFLWWSFLFSNNMKVRDKQSLLLGIAPDLWNALRSGIIVLLWAPRGSSVESLTPYGSIPLTSTSHELITAADKCNSRL